jgi:hypothetical protein
VVAEDDEQVLAGIGQHARRERWNGLVSILRIRLPATNQLKDPSPRTERPKRTTSRSISEI